MRASLARVVYLNVPTIHLLRLLCKKQMDLRLFQFNICLWFLLGCGGHCGRPFWRQNAFLGRRHQAQSRGSCVELPLLDGRGRPSPQSRERGFRAGAALPQRSPLCGRCGLCARHSLPQSIRFPRTTKMVVLAGRNRMSHLPGNGTEETGRTGGRLGEIVSGRGCPRARRGFAICRKGRRGCRGGGKPVPK